MDDSSSDSSPISANKRSKSNADGLVLTKSGRASLTHNEVNAKYDASYRNSDNDSKLFGRHLTLGAVCGIISVALYGAEIPSESSGCVVHIHHISNILHIIIVYNGVCAGHSDCLLVFKAAVWYALIDEELDEILSCCSESVFKAYLECLFSAGCRLWKFIMPVEARSVFQRTVFHPTTVSEKM
jgi:hypothetical protein